MKNFERMTFLDIEESPPITPVAWISPDRGMLYIQTGCTNLDDEGCLRTREYAKVFGELISHLYELEEMVANRKLVPICPEDMDEEDVRLKEIYDYEIRRQTRQDVLDWLLAKGDKDGNIQVTVSEVKAVKTRGV